VHLEAICYVPADCDSSSWVIVSNGGIFDQDRDCMGSRNEKKRLIRGVNIVLSRGILGHTRDYLLDQNTMPNGGQYSRRLILQLIDLI
jgi:hypothetical protein